MAESTAPIPVLSCYWRWMCPVCGGVLLMVKDTHQGRHLLAALVRASESTADALQAAGTLTFVDHLAPALICQCEDPPHG